MSDFFTSLSPHFHATMRLRYVMFFCIVKESIRSPSRIVFTISRFHVHIYVISRCFCMNHNISLMKSWKQENTKMATWNHTTWKFENVKTWKAWNQWIHRVCEHTRLIRKQWSVHMSIHIDLIYYEYTHRDRRRIEISFFWRQPQCPLIELFSEKTPPHVGIPHVYHPPAS